MGEGRQPGGIGESHQRAGCLGLARQVSGPHQVLLLSQSSESSLNDLVLEKRNSKGVCK